MKNKITIIAEAGHNHNGDIVKALELVHQAKEGGADVVKFQLYDADIITRPGHMKYYWELKATQLTKDQLAILNAECQSIGIEFMVSVFDGAAKYPPPRPTIRPTTNTIFFGLFFPPCFEFGNSF